MANLNEHFITERARKVALVLSQYEDGAWTYIDFVRAVLASVTEQDTRDHNEMIPRPSDGGSAAGDASWPFEG